MSRTRRADRPNQPVPGSGTIEKSAPEGILLMKLLMATLFVSSFVWAQEPAAMPPETVVARIDGKPITAGELAMFLQANPPEAQKNFLQDPQAFIERLALMRRLAELGEKAHLDQQPEVKQALELFHMQTLANAEVSAAQDAIPVTTEEQKKYYEAHRDQYSQAKVKLIFISFAAHPKPRTDPQAKKYLSEAEAKAKIEKLLGEIRGGADFVKLAKENSDDKESAARDGDFGTPIRKDDKLQDSLKNAIFALKPGQVSDPVRYSGGFYLFRLEELDTQPFEQVHDQVFMSIRQKRFDDWPEKTRKSLDVKIENPDFFRPATGGATPAN
jgi:peptidyl-prolyl cis-trans isomerase C